MPREQRPDDAGEHVAGSPGRQARVPGRGDRRPARGLRDERALPLEHDDRARLASESRSRSRAAPSAPPRAGRPASRAISPGCGVRIVGVSRRRAPRSRASPPAGARALRPSASITRGTGHWRTNARTSARVPGPGRGRAPAPPRRAPRPGPGAAASAASREAAPGGRRQRLRHRLGPGRGHDEQAGLGRRHRDEAAPAAQGAARGQHGRTRLAHRARHDQQVPEVALVGAAAAAREGAGRVLVLEQEERRRGRGQAPGPDADVGHDELPDVVAGGREHVAALGRGEGDGHRRPRRGPVHRPAVRRQARGQVHRHDRDAGLEAAQDRRDGRRREPGGRGAQARAEDGVHDQVGLLDALQGRRPPRGVGEPRVTRPPDALAGEEVDERVALDSLPGPEEKGLGPRAEPARDDEAVAPVVAAAAQHDHAAGPREALVHEPRHRRARVLHQDRPGQPDLVDRVAVGPPHLVGGQDGDHANDSIPGARDGPRAGPRRGARRRSGSRRRACSPAS